MAQDNIKNLYDALKSDYDLGSEDDFRNSLKDANNRRNLYKAIEGDYDLGSEQDFEKALGYGNRVNGTNEANKANTTTNTQQRNFTQEEYGRLSPTAQEAAQGVGVAPNNGANETKGADKANVQERKPRVQFVPEASNVKGFTVAKDSPLRRQYPFLDQLGDDEQAFFKTDTNEPLYAWKDSEGKDITPDEAATLNQRADIEQNDAIRPHQVPVTSLYFARGANAGGVKTDKSVAGYVDSLIKQQYGNDYQDKQWTTEDGRTVSGAELLENMAQETYDQLNNDVKEARIALFEANGDKDAESKINTAMITKWQGVMSDKRMLETLHDENAMKQDVKDYAQGEIDKAREEERRIIEEMNKRGEELDAASSPYVDQTFNTRQVDNRYTFLTTKLNAVRDRIRSWEAVRDSDDYGAMRALKDTAGNLRSWDLGYSDMIKGMHLVFGTEQDKKELANLLGNAERAKNFEQKAISDFARYVQIGGQSLPFMATFVGSGGGFRTLSEGVAKGAVKWAERKALQGIQKNAVKYLGVAAGDILAGYTLSGTLQGMGTLGDIMQRKAGDIVYNQEKGEYEIANPNGWIESTYKGATASMIDNATELLGDHLNIGKAAMKLLPKAGLKQVSDWLTKAGKSELYTTTREWLKRAGINGLGDEILEEEMAIPMNAVFVGDNPLLFGDGGLLDAKTQKDIVFGVGLSVFAMNAAAVSLHGTRQGINALQTMFDKDQRRLDAADNTAIEIIGGHKWTEIKNNIDNATNEELAGVAQKIADDKGLNEEQKKAASEYITSTLQMRGHNLGENAAMQAREQRDTYLDGILSSEERQNVHDDGMIHAAVLYPDAQQGSEAQEVFITKGNVVMNADGTIDTEASDKEIYYKGADGQVHIVSPDKLQAVAEPISVEDYVTANRPDEANEPDMAEEIVPGQVVNINVDGQTYQATVQGTDGNGNVSVYYQDANGMDRPATFTIDEIRNANRPNNEEPPVGGAGAVVENAEPNGTNEPNASQTAEDRMPIDVSEYFGNAEEAMATAKDIIQNGEVIGTLPDGSVQMQKDGFVVTLMPDGNGGMNVTGIERTGNNTPQNIPENGNIGAKNIPQNGENYSLSDKVAGNGERFYQDNNGNIDLVKIPQEVFTGIGYTAAPFRLTPSMIQHMINRHGRETGISNEQEAIDFVMDVMTNFDHVRLGYDGALIFSIEDGRSRTGKRAVTVLINSDNGEFYGLKTSGYEAIKGLEKRPLLWERGANEKASSTDAASASVPTGKSPISGGQSGSASHQSNSLSGSKDNANNPNLQGYSGENGNYGRTGSAERAGMPTDEKGNPRYQDVPVEATIADLYDGSLNDDEVQGFIDANINEAQKKYDSVQKKAPKIGTNKAKYLEQKRKWQADVDEAKRVLDYWNEVNNAKESLTHTTPQEIEAAQAELSGQAAREEYAVMNENVPANPVAVASDFIRGAKITPESFKAETGYGTGEQRRFVGMIASAENGGKSIDRLAEDLVSYDNAELGGIMYQGDTSAAKDAILEALQSAGTRGELATDNTAEQERYVEARRAELDAQYMEAYGMTYEDYLAYEEQNLPNMLRKYANFDEVEFYNLYADEIEQSLNARINEQGNDTAGEEPRVGGGNEVLPGEGTDNVRGSEGGTEQGTEVPAGVQGTVEDGAVPEKAQQLEPEPIGTNRFGNIYNWVKGQFQSAASFLNNLKSGYLRGVFYRDGIGNIDMVWGNEKAGLQHIINKHIEEADDFNSVEEAMQVINETINNGTISQQGTNISLDYKGYRVSIAQSNEGNWVLTAFDKTRSRAEKQRNKGNATIGDQSVSDMENGTLVSPQLASSESKDTQTSSNKQAVGEKIEEKPFATVDAKRGTVELYRATRQTKEGITITRVVARRNGKEVRMPFASMPLPPNYEMVSIPDGVDVVGVKEIREYNGKAAATVVVRYEDGTLDTMGTRLEPKRTEDLGEKIAQEEANVEQNPTEAQKEAGNYKKGHIKIDGYDVTIENPKGSVRSGVDRNGQEWSVTMNNTYGYIRGTEGVDGDHIDVFLSDDPTQGDVYVIDQVNEDGSFDEHKVMYGFKSALAARRAYLANYSPGWKGLGTTTKVSKEEFKKWINSSHRKTKPFAEYKSVKKDGAQNEGNRALSFADLKDRALKVPGVTVFEETTATNGERYIKVGNKNSTTTYWFSDFAGDNATVELRTDRKILAQLEKKHDENVRLSKVKTANDFWEYLKSIGEADPKRGTAGYDIQTYIKQAKQDLVNEQYLRDVTIPVVEFIANENNNEVGRTENTERTDTYENRPLSLTDMREVEPQLQPQQVDIEGLTDNLRRNGEARLSDHIVIGRPGLTEKATSRQTDNQTQETEQQPQQSDDNGYGANNKLVSRDRYEELKKRMRQKLGGQLNMGIDPKILAIGTEMAAFHIEAGARKFADYARHMIDDLGDAIRPYLKSFYNGVRDLPEVQEAGYVDEMTPYDEVRTFDVANFDKPTINALDTAQMVVQEQEINKQAENAKNALTEQRNEKERQKRSRNKKKSVSSQQTPDLFGNVNAEQNQEDDNYGLQRNDGAVRAERLPTDRGDTEEPSGSMGETVGQESRKPDRSAEESGSGELRRSLQQSERLDGQLTPRNRNNNHVERGTDYAPTTPKARYDANVEAVRLAKELTDSGQQATDEQKAILRQFSGWGGLGTFFNNERTRNELVALLGDDGYQQAAMSINSAYYTPADVIDAMWDIVKNLGFKGGNILEGSAGIGNILGLMPMDISDRSNIEAVEIDGVSGMILKLLYPDAKVNIQGFENTQVRNGSVELAITNVPFVTGLHVHDTTGDRDLSRRFGNIHDFCIAKNVRKLREGGIGVFISSSGTLDKSKALRDWVVNEGNADFIGAFRLNNKTFGGTTATSDIIVVRKRINGNKSAGAIDLLDTESVRTVNVPVNDNGREKIKPVVLQYNKYFVGHPENMGGEMALNYERGETFRPEGSGLFPTNGINQRERMQQWAETFKDKAVDVPQPQTEEPADTQTDANGNEIKDGTLVVGNDGSINVMYLGRQEPLGVNDKKVKGHTKAECVEDYNRIKRALNAVLEYETTNEKDDGLKPLLKELNDAYDSFKDKYGNLNKNTAISFLRNDIDFPSIQALEKFNETNDKDGKRIVQTEKTSIFTERVVQKEVEPHPTNVLDAVKTSVFRSGRIDLNYISNALGRDVSDIEKEIIDNGLGYRDPATGNMEVSYEYLSGNVRQKLAIAEANNEDGRYDKNIKALRKVMPMDIPAHLIEFTFGSSWVNPKLFSDYVNEKTGVPVTLTNVGGQWNMDLPYYTATEKNKSEGVRSEKLNKIVLGTDLMNAAINNRTITVSTTQRTWDGRTETITDKEATQACAAKIDDIRNDFKDWARAKMQSDPEMAKEIEQVYNERFNNYVPKTVTEEFMPDHFPGATKMINLYPHQKKAVIRATSQPLMLAHEVGTGKTFTLITTAMEMRRLGLARKPMIVVQNATVGQFVASAKELYPNAKVLTIADNERNEEGRKRFYAKIKYNDWDMIVVPQSVFERIPDSEERQMDFINDRIEEKEHVLEQIQEIDPKSMIARNAKRELDSLQTELAEVSDKKRQKDEKRAAKTRQNAAAKAQEQLDRATDDVENFDDMEIDAVLVDEAHEYKHLGFSTAMQRGVKGVDPSYSKKSAGVYLKTRAVMEKSNGKNVVFATGTPISNTAAEIWTFMRYLMPKHTMEEYGIYYFDDFVRNFGNLTQMLEFTTSGKFRENNRFSGYVNIPELIRIWSSVSDTVLTKETNLKDKLPETVDGGQKATDIYLPQSASLRSIMKAVRAELERFDNMSGKEKKENSAIPLVMYGIAKAAAIDPRLVMADAVDEPVSKTNRAVEETLKSLEATKEYKGTVAIFCDTYQNNQTGFNIYEEIKRKLVERGVPENQIVIMRSGMSVNKKAEIFDKVNAGDVRVIMGSTFTLGTGVNIQERLNTLIHLDAPNRPMDYTQRNGRILRQGNLHKEWGIPVKILRFGVEDSLDITAYQRLKTKGAIADSVMEGKKFINNNQQDRTLEEQEDVFGDTVAQLSGSEYALLKNQAERDFRKYSNKKKQYEADQIYVHNAIPRYEGQIKASEETVKQQQKALSAVEKAFPDGTVQEITIGNSKLSGQKAIGDYIKDVVNKKQTETEDNVRKGAQGTKASSSFTIKAGPFTFTVNTEYSKDTEFQNGSLFPIVHRNMTYSCDELGLSNVPVQRASFKNAVDDIMNNVLSGNDMRERIETENNSIERNRSELEQLKSREGKPFENEKELEEARKKVEDYTEKMRKEMEAKEKKYAEMDAQTQSADLGSLSGAEEAEEDGETLYREADGYNGNISISEEEANDLFRVVDDASEIERLNSEPTVKVYRAMSLVDGKLYPPMSKKIGTGSNRVSQAPSEFGQWEVSDERPEFVEKEGAHKNHIYIVKDNGKGLWVAYNPYFHTSRNPLNDQFAEAYQRPNLVTVEVEVPESELTSGYQAEGAKDPVGETKWNAGPVNRQLSGDKKRKVILSRWMRPVRIVPDSEVAQHIAELIEGEDVAIPDNTVTPSLLEELKKLGVKIVDGISKGRKKASAMMRGGSGALTDDELSLSNDPVAKMTGRQTRTAAQRRAFAERERQRMVNAVQELARKLHLDNVDIVTDTSTLQGRRAKAKGFYSRSTGRITIVIPNHTDIRDVEQTLLHEAVAHYGLRQLFGEHFDTFLDNVYNNVAPELKQRIDAMAQRHGWSTRTATEEYLASLAENTNFENSMMTGWWNKIKQLFLAMLHKIGFEGFTGVTLSDNELRYILWRSYENLAEPGRYRSIIGEVRDIAKQHELGVGNYATTDSQDRAADILGEQRMEEANRQFNEELDAFKAKTHKGLLHLGQPGRILNACGINAELTLSPTVLSRKLKQHGLDVDDIKGLAGAIQKPILVYKHGDVHPNIVVVTDLTAKGGKISIAIELDGKGNVVELNNVSSVHSKVATTELERISNMRDGYLEQALRWVDKNKVSDWLGIADLNSPIHANNPKLVSVANILQNFENPSVEGEKNNDNVLYREADDAEEDLGHEWQDEYDRRTLSAAFKFTEAAQDGMKSVSILQDVISKETGKPIKEDENVWALQNRLSSTNKYEQDYFYENYYKPLMRAVGNLVKAGASYDELGRNMEDAQDDILKYLISKHGVERNAHFREVAAMEARRPYEESIEEIRKAVEEGEITQEEADKQIEKLTEQANEAEEKSRIDTQTRDYSGLSELYNNKIDFDDLAEQYVSDFESKFDTADLWNKINAATKATLRKTYEAGLISRSGYEATRDMYQYYIPLRGWSNDVASEMYNYKGQQGVGGRIMKRAKGRKSLAENPLAVIGRMGQDGILQANKNRVKQRLYNLAIGHDTSLLSISKQWYVNEGTKENPDWQRAYPELSGDMGADEVAAALKEFDEEMKALQEEGMATQRRDGLTLKYHTTTMQEQQHRVNVSIGGREYNIYVNGNPRAAQAINGELRMDDEGNSIVQRVNRWLANVYTSLNPEFVVTNYERDAGFAAAIVAATETPAYQAGWIKNMAKFNPLTTGIYINHLISKSTKGQINPDNTTERYMQEFLANGGETGFTNMLTADDYKKLIKKEIKEVNKPITASKAGRVCFGWAQRANRVFEDATRFATYVTSREQGRSIDRAIRDAKEISLNFNTRGADGMRGDGIIYKFFRNLRHWFIFTNPSIQGLNKAGVAFSNHPVRSTLVIAGLPAILGYGVAALASSILDGDDDEKVREAYMDLPKWIRRTNICIPIGGTKFITIPLSYELRVAYGMGEMFWEIEQGMIEPGELVKETVTQLSDLMPLSFASGTVAQNLSPTIVRPLIDIIQNKDFTGRPIYRENTFNQGMPEYTKAYAGTAKWLTKSSEVLNNAMPKFWVKDYPEPDKYTPGAINVNPAIVEHLLDSYLGGLYTFPAKVAKTVSMVWDEDMRDVRNIPFVNRNVKDSQSGNPITKSAGDRYNTYMKEYRLSKQRWNGYRRETNHGVTEFVPKLMKFTNSVQGQRMFIIDGYKKSLDELDKQVKDMGEYEGYGEDEERKRLKQLSNDLKQELVNRLDSVSMRR